MATLSRFASRPSSGFGAVSPSTMGRSYASGRSYMDPSRAAERWSRWDDRMLRQKMAGGAGGGGSRGGYGGGGQPPMMPSPLMAKPGLTDLADLAIIGYGNAPSLGMDYAQANARMQTGLATVGDFAVRQQMNAPSLGSDYNNAIARQNYKRYALMNRGGLMGAAQQALFT